MNITQTWQVIIEILRNKRVRNSPPPPPPPPKSGDVVHATHLDLDVAAVTRLQVELGDLRAQARLHLRVHLVARLHELRCQLHVVGGEAVVRAQCQRAWQETHQVVLWEGGRESQ